MIGCFITYYDAQLSNFRLFSFKFFLYFRIFFVSLFCILSKTMYENLMLF